MPVKYVKERFIVFIRVKVKVILMSYKTDKFNNQLTQNYLKQLFRFEIFIQ